MHALGFHGRWLWLMDMTSVGTNVAICTYECLWCGAEVIQHEHFEKEPPPCV